jgi:PAS domain-containing protein
MVVFVPLSYMDPKDPHLRELRELHTDFQEIFHNCFDGIYVADGSGRSLWLNEGFERAYGVNSRDLTELVALQQRLSEAEADLAGTRSELAQLGRNAV